MAGGATENTTWQATHLWVATFTGVFAESVWKGHYLLERPQDATAEGAAAGATDDWKVRSLML